MKKIQIFVYLLWVSIFFLLTPEGFSQNKNHPPVITHSFAIEKGPYGSILKLYIEAEDPDGDMFRVATVVDQIGYGRYPTDWIILKPQFRKTLRGYLQWNTFSSNTHYLREWTSITIRVSIFDKAGNESNEVVFPFSFETVNPKSILTPPPSPFDQKDLPRIGNIHINLYEPTLMGNDRGVKED